MLTEQQLAKARAFKTLFLNRYRTYPAIQQDADDFESFCIESMLRRKSVDLNFEWMRIDFLRSKQCSRTKDADVSDWQSGAVVSQRAREGLALLLTTVTSKMDHAIAVLLIHWGFSLQEIADTFGVTLGAISQRVTAMRMAYGTKGESGDSGGEI